MNDLNKFDIVSCAEGQLVLILSDEMEIPFYHDGVASELAMCPLDIQNKGEWEDTFTARIGYNLTSDHHVIVNVANIKYKYDGHVTEGYIPYDHGTGGLRMKLGLIALGEKFYGKSNTSFFSKFSIKMKEFALRIFQ